MPADAILTLCPSPSECMCESLCVAQRQRVCEPSIRSFTLLWWQTGGELLSHFFIITFPALLHLSPLEVKKVIKGLAFRQLRLFASSTLKIYFSSTDSFANTAAFATKAPHFRGAEDLSFETSWRGFVKMSLTFLLNKGCFATHLTAL